MQTSPNNAKELV